MDLATQAKLMEALAKKATKFDFVIDFEKLAMEVAVDEIIFIFISHAGNFNIIEQHATVAAACAELLPPATAMRPRGQDHPRVPLQVRGLLRLRGRPARRKAAQPGPRLSDWPPTAHWSSSSSR
jgi:hypothetical protein